MFKFLSSIFKKKKDDTKFEVECDFISGTVKVKDEKALKDFMVEQIKERDKILNELNLSDKTIITKEP